VLPERGCGGVGPHHHGEVGDQPVRPGPDDVDTLELSVTDAGVEGQDVPAGGVVALGVGEVLEHDGDGPQDGCDRLPPLVRPVHHGTVEDDVRCEQTDTDLYVTAGHGICEPGGDVVVGHGLQCGTCRLPQQADRTDPSDTTSGRVGEKPTPHGPDDVLADGMGAGGVACDALIETDVGERPHDERGTMDGGEGPELVTVDGIEVGVVHDHTPAACEGVGDHRIAEGEHLALVGGRPPRRVQHGPQLVLAHQDELRIGELPRPGPGRLARGRQPHGHGEDGNHATGPVGSCRSPAGNGCGRHDRSHDDGVVTPDVTDPQVTDAPATDAPAPPGPLDGVRVLDLSAVVMGPFATQILGDLGAEVIVVEGTHLETNRVMGAGPHPQLSGVAMNLMRNKRSVRLDYKHADGRKALLRIAATCDVVVTNIRPAALARAGLTYADLAAVRPDVIYCEAHGYPLGSERQDDPAYDDVIQAGTGVADASRIQTGKPALVPTIFADKLCGLTIAYAVSAALYRRAQTGEGDHIEVPMSETATAFVLVEHGAAAIPRPPLGPAGYPRILTPNRRPQATTDGWIHVLPYSKAHYEALFAEAGREDLIDPELYASGRARIGNADQLYRQVQAVMATRTTDEWLSFCRRAGVPATRVETLHDLVEALPEADHPVGGRYKVIPPPVRFARAPASVRRPAPLVGEHTDEVLAEVGYAADTIAALHRDGAVPPSPEDR
jgi:crotonobetainyl-CoA:carnitine CoA-transferase CaiB-like acyl-CoA transferase